MINTAGLPLLHVSDVLVPHIHLLSFSGGPIEPSVASDKVVADEGGENGDKSANTNKGRNG